MSRNAPRIDVRIGEVRGRLGDVKLLAGLDAASLRNLERRCSWYLFAANQMILQSGDRANRDIYFVIKGAVRVVSYATSGREIAFATIREGECFGELAALTDKPSSASFIANTDCRLASVASGVFRKLICDNPGVGLEVIARLADVVVGYEQRIMELSTLSAVQRVHVELLRLAERSSGNAGGWVVSPIPTHADIASRAVTSRETVVRAINRLAEAGIVERRAKALCIREPGRLSKAPTRNALKVVAAQPALAIK